VLADDRRQRENQRLPTHAATLNGPAVDQRGTDSGRIQRCCPPRIQSADSTVAAGLHRLAVPRPDGIETKEAAWCAPAALATLVMHPAMRLRLHDALTAPHRAHFE